MHGSILVRRSYTLICPHSQGRVVYQEKTLPCSNFNDLDVNSWAKAAKSGGLKYGKPTGEHIDGFALWNTKISKHDVASSPHRKDIVKEYTDAFRKNKLKVGLYYAIWDRRWDRDSSIDQVDAIKVEMKELLDGKYGTIDMLWLDGWGYVRGTGNFYQEIREYIREISPSTVVLNNDHENSSKRLTFSYGRRQ